MDKFKKLLFVIFVMIAISFSFAQSTVGGDFAEIDTLKFLSYLHQVVFFILWPFISLAGLALSSKFVTGDAVGLGEAIFAFWASIKTFAFFIIGFMFVGGVLVYMIGVGKGKSSPRELIGKLILAVIGIPLSYWLFLFLLDLSTILTISVGTLPLKISEATNVTVPNVSPHVKITTGGVAVYYTVQLEDAEDLINIVSCVFEGGVLSKEQTQKLAEGTNKSFNNQPDINQDYCLLSMNRVSSVGENQGKPYEEVLRSSIGVASAPNTLSTYMSNPLTPLFTSLLNMSSNLEVSATTSLGKQLFKFLFNLLVSLALFIPLVVLAVVLLIRGVVLRALIAFAPFLLLAWIFGFKWGDAQGRYSISSVLGLIFLPVTVVFAISLSLIFLSSVSKIDSNGQEEIFTAMGFKSEGGELRYQVTDEAGISLFQTSDNIDFKSIGSFFSMLFKVGVGIALMWIIVFAALKTTKITEGVVSSVQGFAEGYLKSLRVIPVPGMGMMSVGGIQRGWSQVTQTVPGELVQKQYSAQVEPILDEVKARFAGGSEDRKTLSKLNKQLAEKSDQESIPILSKMLSIGITSTEADLNTFREKNMALSGKGAFWAKVKEFTGKEYDRNLEKAIQDPAFLALAAPELEKDWDKFEIFYKKALNKDLSNIKVEETGNLKQLGEDEVLQNVYYIPSRFPDSVIMKDPQTKNLLVGSLVWNRIRKEIDTPEKLQQVLIRLAKAKDPNISFENIEKLENNTKSKIRSVLEVVANKLYGGEEEIAGKRKDEIIQQIMGVPNESSGEENKTSDKEDQS